MTTMTADLDFLMAGPEESGGEPTVETLKGGPPKEEREKPDDGAERQAALDDIVSVLIPSEEGAKPQSDEGAKGEGKRTESPVPTEVVPQPIIHDPRLLRLAGSWGIGPDDAARYPNDEALLGAVALREIRFRNSEAVTARRQQPETLAAKVAAPVETEIKLDDDVDPSIKTVIASLVDQNKKLKSWAEQRISAQEEVINGLHSGQEQAALRETQAAEAKIAQLFDEKVAGWGEEFKELLGVPTQTWAKPGTKECAELQKLNAYARQRAAGYESLTGAVVTMDDIAGFLEEGRYALWPERIKQAIRADISNGLKKQRGGVGLRPGKARSEEPAEQGDGPAKAAIGDFMAEHGLDPWARRKAS